MKRYSLFLFLSFSISSLFSQTIYISPTGNDNNSGLDTAHALATVTHAVNLKQANQRLDIFILYGNYNQIVSINQSGTSSFPITIQAYDSSLKPIFWGFDSSKINSSKDAMFRWADKSDYITLDGIVIRSATANNQLRGFWMNGDHMVIRNCEVHTVIGSGIVIQGNYNLIENNLVDSVKGYYLDSAHYLAGNNIDVESYYYNSVRRNSEFNTIQFNTLKNNPSHFGINLFPDTGDRNQPIMSGNRILYNRIDSTSGGIYTRYQFNLEIIGNLISHCKKTSPWVKLTQGGGIMFDAKWDSAYHPIPFDAGTIKIYNNTIADNEVYGILNNTSNKLYVKNNIFSNNGIANTGDGHILMNFPRAEISPNTTIDRNCYYGTLRWRWGSDAVYPDIFTFANWVSVTGQDINGLNKDPQFQNSSASNYKLLYGSPVKNAGEGLHTEGVSMDIDKYPRPYWNKDYDIGACEVQGDAQLKIGITSGTNFTFTLSTPGTYWQRDTTGLFSINSNPNYSVSSFTVPNADTNKNNWKGWDLGWLSIPNDSNKQFAHGVYKLTYKVGNDTSKYIFIDYRDAISTYSPNIYIQYNSDPLISKFQIHKNGTFYGNDLDNGSVLSIWELNNSKNSNTTGLSNYWANALVTFFDTSNHPVLIWGHYPNATSYRVFRYNSGVPIMVDTSVPEFWTDSTVYKNYNQLDSGTHYYVSTWWNLNTNTVSVQETNNETWSGNINMANIVKVPTGKTLTINPGTRINLYSTSSFNVLGKVIAEGTSSNQITFTSANGTTPGSWGTLTLNGAHNSSIKYARILFGTEIDVINSNNVVIQNCNIDSSSMHGINFSGGTGCIAANDTIKNSNTAHGILIQNGAGVTCTANAIKKTTYNHSGVGIYYGAGGNGIAAQNDITGFSWGIGASWGATLTTFNPNSSRNNRVANCDCGLMVYNESYAMLGNLSPTDLYCNNSIQGISYHAYTHNTGSYHSGISGFHNYWGYPLNASKLYCGTGSYFYYGSNLPNDPWAGIASLINVKLPENISNTETKNCTFQLTGETADNSFNNTSVLDSLIIGINLKDKNQNKEAKDFFISYQKLHPENQAVYPYLFSCADQNTIAEITNFFTNLPAKASAEHQFFLTYLYLRQGKVDLAKEVNNKIITNNLNTPLGVRAILNNFYISLYNENNIETAQNLLKEVKSKADLSTEMEIATAEDLLRVYSSVINPNLHSSVEKQIYNVKEQPKSYYLSQNYPNPFNPSTTIIYSVKDPGIVRLEIFDILGRKVRTLLDEEKQPGEYKVNFNAYSLASGVYIYRLTAGTFTQIKKMQLLK